MPRNISSFKTGVKATSLKSSSSTISALFVHCPLLHDQLLNFRNRYKDRAAFEAHGNSEHFQKAGKTMAEEELLAKPLDIKVLGALAGFAGK